MKDLSFENFMPNFSNDEKKNDIKANINIENYNNGDNFFEVVLIINIKSTMMNKTIYIVEISYAGMFLLDNKNDDKEILFAECAQILFPQTRNIISTITADAGYKPLYLKYMNFKNIYLEQRKRNNSNYTKY